MILVHEPEAEQLTVALFHRSAFGPADEIGRCQVRMQCLHIRLAYSHDMLICD